MKQVAPLFKSFIFFFVLIVSISFPLRQQGYGSTDSIAIGEIDPLTGKLAKHGQEIHEGILYAIEELNSQGGIKGRRIKLISRDDQSQVEVAINQAEDLLYRERVAGLVGGYVDSLVAPVSELAAKHRTPYVASASLQRGLTLGRKNPYFFRVAHLSGMVRPLCDFVLKDLKPKRAAILFSATPGATELGNEVRDCLKRGGVEIPIFEKFRPGSPDFSAFLLKVRRSGVDLLVSGGFFADHLILVRQLKEQRIDIKAYLGPWGVAYPAFIEMMGEASEGLFGMCAWSPGVTQKGTEKESRSFERGFAARFDKIPNTTTMHGYTSARALLSAITAVLELGKELTGDNICAQLRSLDILMPMERLEFDEKGDPKHYQQAVVQIQKGQMIIVYPPERATGQIVSGSGF